jgi:hypothetical protein
MSAALALIQTVENNGGRLRVDGVDLVIEPKTAALPVLEALREHKSAIIEALNSRPPQHDPDEWRKPFIQWLDSTCAVSPRCFGGVSCLHLAFCDWEIARDEVPCTRDTFELLLSELGFLMGEVSGVMLVSGLTFLEDFEACQ